MTTLLEAGSKGPGLRSQAMYRRYAAIGSFVAALVHYAVVPEHVDEWWAHGVFFSAIGMFQLVWAVLAYTGEERPMLLAGLLVNLGALALWAVSRTEGLPFGPEAGEAEAVGVLDVTSVVIEIAVVAAILLALFGRRTAVPDEPGESSS